MQRENRILPSEYQHVAMICKFELRKLIHSKRVLGIIGVSVLAALSIASIILSQTEVYSTYQAVILGFVSYSPIFIVISGTLIGSDALLVEFHEKTGYSLFPNPVSRSAIWFGKFISCEIIMFGITALFFGILSAAALTKTPDVSGNLLLLPFSFSFATLVLSFAFLASAVFKGPIGAMATVFFSLLFMPALDAIMAGQQLVHWFTPASVVNHILSLLVGSSGPIGFPFVSPDEDPGIVANLSVMAVYIAIPSAASIYLFNRRDM